MTKPRAPKPATKPTLCLTCYAKVDVRFVDGSPVFYDAGTETIHACPK